jgi:hypothetical protein
MTTDLFAVRRTLAAAIMCRTPAQDRELAEITCAIAAAPPTPSAVLECAWCHAGMEPGDPGVMVQDRLTCGEPCAKRVRVRLAVLRAPVPGQRESALSAEQVRRDLTQLFGRSAAAS